MLRRKAYKFALKTTPEQEKVLVRFAGSCRFVWNRMLALQKQRLDDGDPVLRYSKAALLLPGWKIDLPWLKTNANSQSLQQTLKSLDRALMDAFDKSSPKKFPRFKKKGSESFCIPQHFKLDQGNGRVFLPKLGWLKFRNSKRRKNLKQKRRFRKIEGTVKNVTVSRSCGRWYVSFQVEQDVESPVHASTSAVGVDVGVKRFATLSTGEFFKPLNSFKKHEQRLAKEQRRLAKKVKFSNNWKKQKQKISRLHQRIAFARADYLHKLSTTISKNHAIVVLEDLQIKNMSASARGSLEQPGRNVNQKQKLNRSILDQGWYEFRRQLDYKLQWAGGQLLLVPPQYTSQTCPKCGYVSKDNRKKQAVFLCCSCGYADNADFVAATNILAAGHVVSACGDPVQSDRSMKQEPTEVNQADA